MNQPKPIFIIGAPRSGTSITTWALGQHPNIQPMPETAWIASSAVGAFLSFAKGSERGKFSHLSNVDFPLEAFMAHMGTASDKIVNDAFERRCKLLYGEKFRETGIEAKVRPKNRPAGMQLLRSIEDPKSRWVDGTPLNTQFLWGLKLMFPDARFLHLLRAPEEVGASLLNFDDAGGISQPAKEALHTWSTHTENASLALKAFGPETVLTVRYETLIDDQEHSIRTILDFLSEPYSPHCLQPYDNKINSSKVDDKREDLQTQIRKLSDYRQAKALHASADQPARSDEDAASALDLLKQRFLDHCFHRTLI